MRIQTLALWSLFLGIGSGLNVPDATSAEKKQLFLLEEPIQMQWCAYNNESAWKSDVNRLGAIVVATLGYADDTLRVSKIDVTEADQAGDWIVYDNYALDENEHLRKLKRTINVSPGDRSEEEVYTIKDSRATKQASISRELSTGKTAGPEKVWLPEVPIITQLQNFPFASFIGKGHPEVWSTSKVCIAVKHQ